MTLRDDARFYTALGGVLENSIQRELDRAIPAVVGARVKEATRASAPIRICRGCGVAFVQTDRGRPPVRCDGCLREYRARQQYLASYVKHARRKGAFIGQLRKTA